MTRRLVLASSSPRRLLLLRQIGLTPEVIPSSAEELFDASVSPQENAHRLALLKAETVAGSTNDAIVVGADTVVVLGDELFGKPVDRNDATSMLQRLSGRTHRVVTAFAMVDVPGGRKEVESEETAVTFRDIPSDEIERYVDGGSPMDKAGAYGIQDDYGAVFVSRIEGCYYNVVGLPLSRFWTTLNQFTSVEVERNIQ